MTSTLPSAYYVVPSSNRIVSLDYVVSLGTLFSGQKFINFKSFSYFLLVVKAD